MDTDGRPQYLEEEGTMPHDIPKHQRSMRSLNVLATRFVRLLQEAEDGVLDLKEAVRVLAVGQKRRIYDITNVLEGVGVIVKISKNFVKWMGSVSGETTCELMKRLRELKSELEDLEQMEFMLDQQTHWLEQSIRNTTQDCSNLNYVNHEDICNCFSGNTLLTIRAPSGTQLDVPIPKAVQDSSKQYQIHLRSISGPIDVVLLNKHSVDSVPVVLPVPPPEEILQSAKLAMSTSEDTASSAAQAPSNSKHSTTSRLKTMENMQPLHAMSFKKTEPNRIGASKCDCFSLCSF